MDEEGHTRCEGMRAACQPASATGGGRARTSSPASDVVHCRPMDPLRKDDIERTRRMSPDERMRGVLAAVNAGVRIRLAALRAKRPRATEGELEAALREWLKDERTDH